MPRFTFGTSKLLDGVEALPFMLGMFAAAEIFHRIKEPIDTSAFDEGGKADISKLARFKDVWQLKWTILRSGLTGTVLGIVPGCGATIASWMSYTLESKFSKHPEMLGKGDPHGIAASKQQTMPLPVEPWYLYCQCVPGSNAAAMMMTALAIHGIRWVLCC